jgi:hypothetical protein
MAKVVFLLPVLRYVTLLHVKWRVVKFDPNSYSFHFRVHSFCRSPFDLMCICVCTGTAGDKVCDGPE